jgi:teichoic acid transport system permease protein
MVEASKGAAAAVLERPPLPHDAPRDHLRRLGQRPALGAYVRDLWRRRELAWEIAVNDLRARNMDTVLGGLWHILNPLLLAAVFYVVFGVILHAKRGIGDYPAFLLTGITVLFYSTKALASGSRAIVNSYGLITNLYFPRAIVPISAVIAEFFSQLWALGGILAIVAVMLRNVTPNWLLVIPLVLVQTLFNLGLAFYTARLTSHLRDVANLLPYLTRIWFYLSGIFFSVESVKGTGGDILRLNPGWVFVHLTRLAVGVAHEEGSVVHYTATSWSLWRVAILWAVGLSVTGFLFFRNRETEYAGE